jgi:hypothetical protein
MPEPVVSIGSASRKIAAYKRSSKGNPRRESPPQFAAPAAALMMEALTSALARVTGETPTASRSATGLRLRVTDAADGTTAAQSAPFALWIIPAVFAGPPTAAD